MSTTTTVEVADMEAAAKTPTGRGRGRPRATPREWDDFAAATESDKSRRTHVKRFRAAMAVGILSQEAGDEFSHILGPSGPRWEVLAELGRLEDPDRILEAARGICIQKLRAKDAVVLIRRWRLGKAAPATALGLAAEITRTIECYRLRHPDATAALVVRALDFVCEYEAGSGPEEGPERGDDDGRDDEETE